MKRYREIHRDSDWCVCLYRGDGDFDLILTTLVPGVGTYELAFRLTEEEALLVIHYDGDGEEMVSLARRLVARRDEPAIAERMVSFKRLDEGAIGLATE